MVNFTAQDILDENKYAKSDITLENTEKLIDTAISYINLETGLTIGKMYGSLESKIATVTDAQEPIVKALASIYVRGYVDGDPNVRLDGETSGQPPQDPHTDFLKEVVKRGIILLRSLRRKGVT